MIEQTTTLTLCEKVLRRIDEISPQVTDGTVAAYSIEEFLDEAVAQLIGVAPGHLLPSTDFSQSVVTSKTDGSGSVVLPVGFARLIEFRMEGWLRPVTKAIDTSHPRYSRQFNRATRGGVAKPIVVINGNNLEYYSLPTAENHKIETAKCITALKPSEVPEVLTDALCWIAAALVLEVQNESTAAELARRRMTEIITTIMQHTQ